MRRWATLAATVTIVAGACVVAGCGEAGICTGWSTSLNSQTVGSRTQRGAVAAWVRANNSHPDAIRLPTDGWRADSGSDGRDGPTYRHGPSFVHLVRASGGTWVADEGAVCEQ